MNPSRLVIALVVVLVAVAGGCEPPSTTDCSSDAQCGAGLVCSDGGECLACVDNGDCAAGEFCCQGGCKPESDIADFCGCGSSPAGSAGDACGASVDAALCLVGGVAATVDNVSAGTCGCGCSIADGGPICAVDGAGAAICSCVENRDCRGAALDAAARPHRVADTCTPDGACVCFSLGNASVCDVDGAAPDCASAGGCAAFESAVDNCGSAGRVCNVGATGVEGTGTCLDGGCACDDISDCADGVNVDACVFAVVGEPARCVCGGYTRAGNAASCPMELACSTGGCELDGVAFATEEALVAALAAR